MLTRMFRRKPMLSLGLSLADNTLYFVVIEKKRTKNILLDYFSANFLGLLKENGLIADPHTVAEFIGSLEALSIYQNCFVTMAIPDKLVMQQSFSFSEKYTLTEQVTKVLLDASDRFECDITALHYDVVYNENQVCYAIILHEIILNYVTCLRSSNLSLKILDVESNVMANADKKTIEQFKLGKNWDLSCALALRGLKNG